MHFSHMFIWWWQSTYGFPHSYGKGEKMSLGTKMWWKIDTLFITSIPFPSPWLENQGMFCVCRHHGKGELLIHCNLEHVGRERQAKRDKTLQTGETQQRTERKQRKMKGRLIYFMILVWATWIFKVSPYVFSSFSSVISVLYILRRTIKQTYMSLIIFEYYGIWIDVHSWVL